MSDVQADLDVAIVHDWFPTIAGGEKVVKEIMHCFPKSEIYTVFDFLSDEERRSFFGDRPVHVSDLNRLPGVERYYRYLLLQATRAIEALDVTRHEAVISSSAALSKGVITGPEQKHFAYIHSPARYAWDLTHEYMLSLNGFAASLKRALAREMMHRFRIWDMRTVAQVDYMIANSYFIKKRIWKTYRRNADVIYPPVDTDAFTKSEAPRGDFFFTASRMVPYKNIHLIVEAFSQRPDLKLIVCGDGPEMGRIKAMAKGNVEFLGHAPFEVMRDHMQRARAFVFAAKEDFGIVPVEAQACGTPVIALGQGGTAETVRGLDHAAPTGVHFHTQTTVDLLIAVSQFEAVETELRSETIVAHAKAFGSDRFRGELTSYIQERLPG
ncbi:glycosyltransferase involved in cell wall biosynthesis [Rhodobacter aestuarii]|uniref:Glycosyltransferase involved in cell wall bisynthesis n=1 Tax=Rhodobacter aestuarii TaxID=453582 RepID=A0A1N7MAE3_9RHOB|nr:glycosyltransferase [Rhodobacter aestuarii]PTV94948.1 glycosyltransferase involved in cell wall biosynthesis [Rhodobacter aestuarii]SIS82941.1 Glycosyltransferase involved in cell wall bisynthesis [Rhodobacter aestuarii]